MMFGKSQITQITTWFTFMFFLNTSKHLTDRHLAYWTHEHTPALSTSLQPANTTYILVNLRCNSQWQPPQQNNVIIKPLASSIAHEKVAELTVKCNKRHTILPHLSRNWSRLSQKRITPHPSLTSLEWVNCLCLCWPT